MFNGKRRGQDKLLPVTQVIAKCKMMINPPRRKKSVRLIRVSNADVS